VGGGGTFLKFGQNGKLFFHFFSLFAEFQEIGARVGGI